ncbi:ATP-binding cassette domain-containing protein [Oryzomicrobium sp.]|uniref:ABC transporter ATP-binding protein n=1 Tax=Oryzomicrobium sp. TaxID=1911578 RepID=UPI0025E3C3B0|nr:ATP-binding cassette domain-containing protein [Oryzomicrobium sp.]MCE1242469.1 ATP-binding cassette domain-containing protein [Oryzomicrobium sp.]
MNGPCDPTPAVALDQVWSRYGRHVIHQGISLEVPRRSVCAIVGGSGSGKTTLLRQMVGLLPPWQGQVRLFGADLYRVPGDERRALKRRLGVLFQQGALFSALSVYDNIAFPLRELKWFDPDLIRALVLQKLAQVELEPRHAHLMPAELSGGMVKRVALARALALEPDLLVLDEPTSGLDPDRSRSFVHLIRCLQEALHFTVVMVTHDVESLSALATQVAVLADGQLVAVGSPEAVRRSGHPFIQAFFAGAPAPQP